MNKVVITHDITDWAEKALQGERFPQTQDELAEMAVEMGAKNAARIAVSGRAMGQVPDDIMPADKDLYDEGSALSVHTMVQAQRVRIERAGKIITVRKWRAVQPTPDEEEADQDEFDAEVETVEDEVMLPDHGYTEAGTAESVANAIVYLRRRTPGYIYNPLKEIAAGGGDVRAAAEELIERIREMVEKLENGG